MRITAAIQAEHRGVLEDAHPLLQRHPAQAAHQACRLHGGVAGFQYAFQVLRRAGAAGHFTVGKRLEDRLAQARTGLLHALPGTALRLGGGGPQPAGAAEVRVDIVGLAEFLDLADGRRRGSSQAQRLILAALRGQRADLRPPGHDEAAVSPGGAATADVALDDGDTAVRLELQQAQRGPEANEAAADDGHVDFERAFQGRQRSQLGGDFLQPQGTFHVRIPD